MLYAEQTAAGIKSPRLSGNYTTKEAADKLLAGSDLLYQIADNGTVTVKPPAKSVPKSDTPTLTAMTVTGEAVQDPNDPFNRSYTVINSSTATKTGTPIMDTSVSVQVVPRTVMDDQKTTRVKDALENVSGVRAQPTLGYGNGFIIRGFRNNRVYRNGLLANADGFPSEYDAGNL